MDPADITHRFAFHPAGPDTGPDSPAQRHGRVRQECAELAHVINGLAPDGREKSLAITALEEAMMWTNAAIARNPVDQQPTHAVGAQKAYSGSRVCDCGAPPDGNHLADCALYEPG